MRQDITLKKFTRPYTASFTRKPTTCDSVLVLSLRELQVIWYILLARLFIAFYYVLSSLLMQITVSEQCNITE
jgi:hypothetical protein